MNIQTIALTQLVPSPANVRKTSAKTGIEELAASIAAHGLLQNLQVRPAKDGNFEVVAGGRRRAALNFLAKQKKIAPDYPVPCHALDQQDAHEISLAENVMRTAMHPADQFEAFRKLADDGQGHEDIAARFGTTPNIVAQRLKLAVVSPKLIALYRKGEMTLDCLMAFTVCDDSKQQEKVWADLPGYARRDPDPDHIRRLLTQKHVAADSKLARFIGISTYEKAGGAVLRDLFDDQNAGWLTDAALVNQLAADKLEKAAETVRGEGWKWVQIIPDLTWEAFNAFDQAQHDGSKAEAGAIIGIDRNGDLDIRRNLIRPEDKAAARKARKAKNGGEAESETDAAEKSGLSAKLVEDLTAHRTAALQATLAGNPKVALAAVVHALALRIFHNQGTSALRIHPTTVFLDRSAEGIDTTKAHKQLLEATKAVEKRLPKSADKLWDWCLAQDQKTLLAVLAVCAGHTVDAVEKRHTVMERPAPDAAHAGQLGKALKLDMADYWQPTAASYFGRVSKGLILEAVTEGNGKQAADNIASLKKHAMADKAGELLTGKNWLPALLRTA
jgi:ParB family transcriptional regulator, chromosome partitioning protein